MYSWLPAGTSASWLAVRELSPPTATVGWGAGMMVKCPEVVTTPAAGLVVMDGLGPPGAGEVVSDALGLPVPGIALVTWKVYSPKPASAPCPGTGRRTYSHPPGPSLCKAVVSVVPSGLVIAMLGGVRLSSPLKHKARSANLWSVKTVSELPAATVVHVKIRLLWNRPANTEFGRYGLDGCVVVGWVWPSGPGAVAEPAALPAPDVGPGASAEGVESVGAAWPLREFAEQPASMAVIMQTVASAPRARRRACW
jgi:hypothetical protein